MRFYKLNDEIEAILTDPELVDQETGEISAGAIAALNELELEKERKLLYLAGVHKGQLEEAEAVDREMKRLRARRDRHKAHAEQLRRFIERNYEPGMGKLEDGPAQIELGRVIVEVSNLDELASFDPFLIRTKEIHEADKRAIAKRMKAEKLDEIPGARLVRPVKIR